MSTGGSRRTPAWSIDAGGAALALVLGVAVYGLVIGPSLDRLRTSDMHRAEAARLRGALETTLGAKRALEGRIDDAERALQRSDVRLEGPEQVNRRIARLTELSEASGLKLREVAPQEPVRIPRALTVPIRLTGTGTYAACARFLAELHATHRDVAVVSGEVAGNPAHPDEPAAFRFELAWYAAQPEPSAAR